MKKFQLWMDLQKIFIDLFNSVGIKKLSKRRKYLKILNKIELQDGEKKFQ